MKKVKFASKEEALAYRGDNDRLIEDVWDSAWEAGRKYQESEKSAKMKSLFSRSDPSTFRWRGLLWDIVSKLHYTLLWVNHS